jgi:hypothetical protein
MASERARVLMLTGWSDTSRMMYHGIAGEADVVCVIAQKQRDIGRLLRGRIRRLGLTRVLGQVLFMVLHRFLRRFARPRVESLIREFGLDPSPIPEDILLLVPSINSPATIERIRSVRPDVIIVHGTSILSREVLGCTTVPFVNTHMGITPRYRGVHGGYWALVQRDPGHCGVTVHLVDPGIDTGGILYSATIEPAAGDCFDTYPIHQVAKAIPLMRQVIRDTLAGSLRPRSGDPPSGLWSHPTLFEYLRNWISLGVK